MFTIIWLRPRGLKHELHLTKSKLQRKQRELEKANTDERESATRSSDVVRELMVLTQNIKDSDETIVRLNGEIHSLTVEVEMLTLQKKSAQNAKNYIQSKNMAINIEHKHALSKKNTYICQLEHELEIARSVTQERATLKDSSGAYSYDTRLAAIELLSLEVAAEKVPKVIQAVGSHVFKQKFSEAELPSKTSVQNMADEGHFIAQSYISSRLQNTEYWGNGIHKYGTSRNKRKLLDTSITLSSGENFSLGFSCVARETGDAISNTEANIVISCKFSYDRKT